MRRHAAPFGTSLLASTRMGPDTPEPRNSSLVAEKIPKRSLRRDGRERAMMIVSKKRHGAAWGKIRWTDRKNNGRAAGERRAAPGAGMASGGRGGVCAMRT